MNKDLIILDKGKYILSPEKAEYLAAVENLMKNLKKEEEEIKQKILEEMERKGIISIDTAELNISYIPRSEREVFDNKKLRAENPDLYDEYIKFSPVKSSVRIKVKP